MSIHEKYMKRCLELARKGFPASVPNPSVGAVIVHKNKIIGEGYTAAYGGNHAEVNAIQSVKDISLLSKSTLYVSLEPCSHYGKTPPCADLIVYHKIPKVVIGTIDTFSKVAGNGVKKLMENGIEIILGVLQDKCAASNAQFFTFHEKKRPFIVLKWAETADGFIAPLERNEIKPVWISNAYSKQTAHKLRSEYQAILVGTNTFLADNPSLDTRDYFGESPIRIIIDRENKIPTNFLLKNNKSTTYILTETEKKSPNDTIFYIKMEFGKKFLVNLCSFLYEKDIQSILIEGGTTVLQQFIDENLWDETFIFKSETTFKKGIRAPIFNRIPNDTVKITNNVLLKYSNND